MGDHKHWIFRWRQPQPHEIGGLRARLKAWRRWLSKPC